MKILNWDQYFMALAKISAMRSKDPNTQVGAVLVNDQNRVIGLGYNGMPKGNDIDFPWIRDGQGITTKYPYVVHAEMNAILNAIKSVTQSRLYVSLFPCSSCAKFVAQAGVKEIIYEDDKYQNTEDDQIAKLIFEKSHVSFRKIAVINIKVES